MESKKVKTALTSTSLIQKDSGSGSQLTRAKEYRVEFLGKVVLFRGRWGSGVLGQST
jgi:hypothetical protein